MKKHFDETKPHKLSKLAVASLLVAIVLCSFFVCISIVNKNKMDKMEIEQLILEKSIMINNVVSRHLRKTETLAVLVKQGNGNIADFDILAESLIDDPAIWTMLIAPDGIVSQVYPLKDNEAMIGLDLFGDVIDSREAVLARDSRRLAVGGPFDAVQGGQTIVGRMPVYLDTKTEKDKFWGLVSVSLKFPDALNSAGLDIFGIEGYAYELWRINPNTNEKQIIAGNGGSIHTNFVERPINILNTEWYITASTIRYWYDYPVNIILVAVSLFISLLIFFVVQNNYKLKQMQKELKRLARTDALTGIYNRRFFMELSQNSLIKSKRSKEDCYIIIFDLDKFKSVNDTYGHQIGDKVLIEAAARIKSLVRPYDLFARYGGEEFIILVVNSDSSGVMEITERLRLCLCGSVFDFGSVSLPVSASFGVAHIEDYEIEKATKNADDALYKAKETGRNKVVLHS
ncbi:MAG: sensor domain-containing diguanylate cyclase [Chitinispirillales bacterium]|jgi:diguanylate cyclase (GGDEF)-like protein|nr:sensor domain-containing diguanylate cyclase [Chitinispirillales bacterium]